jgi:hypothetical protein
MSRVDLFETARKVVQLQHLAEDDDYDALACDIDQEILEAAYELEKYRHAQPADGVCGAQRSCGPYASRGGPLMDTTRHEAQHEAACEQAERDLDAACCDMPRAEYNELAVEYLAEVKQEGKFREWLRDNYPERFS